MPEPFKNVFNQTMIDQIAHQFRIHCKDFDDVRFFNLAMHGLENLELKARAENVLEALTQTLPDNFEEASTALFAALYPDTEEPPSQLEDEPGLRGWAILPLSLYVAKHGIQDSSRSLELLKEMTKRFTSEFAIRTFLMNDLETTLPTLMQWTHDPSEHVRRLVSEGTRPRLPWAGRLPRLQEDPSPILPLLEALKDDESEYVRRSVANNLNDISKDHPDIVSQIATEWLVGASMERAALVRHACRSLVKQGHQNTLATLGFEQPSNIHATLEVRDTVVRFGNALYIDATLSSSHNTAQSLMLDFIIHHRKANGGTTPKVFKWTNFTLQPGQTKVLSKRHPMRPITTRRYYPGRHEVELLINGITFSGTPFDLLIDEHA